MLFMYIILNCSLVMLVLYIMKKNIDFKKVEPYLIFLNVLHLDIQEADLQTTIKELQIINHSLRENDKEVHYLIYI